MEDMTTFGLILVVLEYYSILAYISVRGLQEENQDPVCSFTMARAGKRSDESELSIEPIRYQI